MSMLWCRNRDRRACRYLAVLAAVVTLLGVATLNTGVVHSSPGPPAVPTLGVAASSTSVSPPQQLDLDDFTERSPKDLPEAFRKWLEEDAVWIITESERDIYLRLDSDAKREQFIERFWFQRDPTPGTPRNEYFEQHYERIAYANRQFGSEAPGAGWRSDRGRMYILLGEPGHVNRLPNTDVAVPAEVWFYQVDPQLGVQPFFYLVFFRDRGFGRYRLYSPAMHGPWRLLNPGGELTARQARPGMNLPNRQGQELAMSRNAFGENSAAIQVLRTVDFELAQAAVSLIPGEGVFGMGNSSPLASEMLLTQIFDIPRRIMPSAAWAYRVLIGTAEAEVRFETLEMDALGFGLMDPSGVPFLHFAIRADGDRLNLREYDDSYYVTFELAASMTDVKKRVLYEPGKRVMEATLDEEQARTARRGKVIYLDRVSAIPGTHNFDVVLENNVSREFGQTQLEVWIPETPAQRLATGQLILCTEVNQNPAYDRFATHYPFQLGETTFLPIIGEDIPRSMPVQAFHQVFVPPGHSEPIQAIYTLRDAAGVTIIERILRLEASDAEGEGVINQFVSFDLEALQPASYRLSMDIVDDEIEPQTVGFTITEPIEVIEPFVYGQRQRHPTDPAVVLERATQYRSVGDTSRAIEVLGELLRRSPDHERGVVLQIALLKDAGRYSDLVDLVSPRLVQSPNDVDLLMDAAEANARLGQHYDAIRYYERVRLSGEEDSPELFNALASEYFAEGELEKARALLEQSLTVEPGQTRIQQLLDELLRQSTGDAVTP